MREERKLPQAFPPDLTIRIVSHSWQERKFLSRKSRDDKDDDGCYS